MAVFRNFTKNSSRSRLDYVLFGAMILLVILGALCIMSAVNSLSFSNPVVRTHLVALPVGAFAFFVGWSFNYQILTNNGNISTVLFWLC